MSLCFSVVKDFFAGLLAGILNSFINLLRTVLALKFPPAFCNCFAIDFEDVEGLAATTALSSRSSRSDDFLFRLQLAQLFLPLTFFMHFVQYIKTFFNLKKFLFGNCLHLLKKLFFIFRNGKISFFLPIICVHIKITN